MNKDELEKILCDFTGKEDIFKEIDDAVKNEGVTPEDVVNDYCKLSTSSMFGFKIGTEDIEFFNKMNAGMLKAYYDWKKEQETREMSEIDNCWNNNHRLETRTFDKTRTIIAFCLDCNKELDRKEYTTDSMYELAKNMTKAYNLHKKIHRRSDL